MKRKRKESWFVPSALLSGGFHAGVLIRKVSLRAGGGTKGEETSSGV